MRILDDTVVASLPFLLLVVIVVVVVVVVGGSCSTGSREFESKSIQ